MEKFAKIISIEGNYAYNTIGETFYVTNDLLPLPNPCIISYNPKWSSSITRSEIMEDSGEELFYTTILKHVDKVFRSMIELERYKAEQWSKNIIDVENCIGQSHNRDFNELIAI
jgi:hypothetical protein